MTFNDQRRNSAYTKIWLVHNVYNLVKNVNVLQHTAIMAPTTRLQARRYIIEHENTRKEYVTSKKF